MHVEHGLTCRFIDIDTDIISIGMETSIDQGLNLMHQGHHIGHFFLGQIKERCDMTSRDHQHVAGRDGKTIKKG